MVTLAFEKLPKGDGRAVRRIAEMTYTTFVDRLSGETTAPAMALRSLPKEEQEKKLDAAIAFLKSVPGFQEHAFNLETLRIFRGTINIFSNRYTLSEASKEIITIPVDTDTVSLREKLRLIDWGVDRAIGLNRLIDRTPYVSRSPPLSPDIVSKLARLSKRWEGLGEMSSLLMRRPRGEQLTTPTADSDAFRVIEDDFPYLHEYLLKLKKPYPPPLISLPNLFEDKLKVFRQIFESKENKPNPPKDKPTPPEDIKG